jgi:hypothetical protein
VRMCQQHRPTSIPREQWTTFIVYPSLAPWHWQLWWGTGHPEESDEPSLRQVPPNRVTLDGGSSMMPQSGQCQP